MFTPGPVASTTSPAPSTFVHPALSWSDEGLVSIIPPHWLQFEPASKAFFTVTGLVISVIGCVAFLGNAVVVYGYHKSSKRGGSRSNDLVVNLAFCDMMMAAIVPPMYAVSSFHSRWVFGVSGCQFHGFVCSLCGTAAIMTITDVSSGLPHKIIPGEVAVHTVISFSTTLRFRVPASLSREYDHPFPYKDRNFRSGAFGVTASCGPSFRCCRASHHMYLRAIWWRVRSTCWTRAWPTGSTSASCALGSSSYP
ncbi:hypothetical protein RvY_06704 [Ramazzottius varieornatus]|uniref:G-protein coupled receptors family 1 profile domain-containing protein n=1 Tax=Ramazzottius varieornatus TaxID=947166 RepID=A0A1D1V2V7_RAMVA|nr:hypothetical protein RvY_06704 [Ramazzottius varieornatus]